MGGNVGVIIKKENGEQIGMSRWTNIMPHFFKDPNLYLGNTKQWFSEFSEEWLKMKSDYEKNKDTKNFEHNMTDVYFPHSTLSPDEYGIIAVDFQKKKIYSSQDYCNIGSLAFYHIWTPYSSPQEENEQINLIKTYLNNNLIKNMEYYDSIEKEYKSIDISGFTIDDFITMFKEINKTDMSDNGTLKFTHPLLNNFNPKMFSMYSSHFNINSDWTFSIFKDRSIGVLKIKQELDNDGFIFTKDDDNAWKKYLSYNWYDTDEKELEKEELQEFIEFKNLYFNVFKEPFILKNDENNKIKIK